MWIANKRTSDLTILTFGGINGDGRDAFDDDVQTSRNFHATHLADRAKYHYMDSISSISFGNDGRFATCQESTNTYEGKTATGNKFMGPTLFESDKSKRVTSMGSLACNTSVHSPQTCFLRHIDMLHESPLCMGLTWDPEEYSCSGRTTIQKNVYWSFDGYGKADQLKSNRKGMLIRYDFERDHGGCNGYLCADHGEAEVRRYEDVVLTRVDGVPSHLFMDATSRDLFVVDTGGKRLLRIAADSGRSDRTAIQEFPIYSSSHIHFNYKIWKCTTFETIVDTTTEGMFEEDVMNFMPSGVVVDQDIIYLSNFATGNILAIDKYRSVLVKTIKTHRPFALSGIELRSGDSEYLFVVDQKKGELLRISKKKTDAACPVSVTRTRTRRPYPFDSNANTCLASKSVDVGESAAVIGEAIVHDPGYMNVAIPRDYAMDVSIPCHHPETGRSNFNLDALLMAGHTCHRCLPEPCRNGGVCLGKQESGFTCTCSLGWSGDLCQRKDKLEQHKESGKETGIPIDAVAAGDTFSNGTLQAKSQSIRASPMSSIWLVVIVFVSVHTHNVLV